MVASRVRKGERPVRSTPVEVTTRIVKAAKGSRSVRVDKLAEAQGQFVDGNLGADGEIPPRYDAKVLMEWAERSNALRQNVDAYAVNIDGHGHAYEPEIDLEADDTDDKVKAVIQLEQQEASGVTNVADPSDDEVETRKLQLADEQRKELLIIQDVFEYACDESSFVYLRKITRQDTEQVGYGFWEITRDANSRPVRFKYIEAHTMFLMPMDVYTTPWEETRRTASKSLRKVPMSTQFRRYLQRVGTSKVYFKQYNDPRALSARTGKYYKNVAELAAAEPGDAAQNEPAGYPATEIKHFKVHSPLSPYGVPRWIGNLLSVLGARASEEVNYSYFENKSVPPLALLVSGGKLSDQSVTKIEDYIKNEIRGKDNYHKILILEAMGESSNAFENSGQPKIELKPLTEAQNSDALFQNYDERSMDKVGMAFRIPRMLRGDTRDFNRSTAEAALDFAERQVFGPERGDSDYFINRSVLPELGIKHWKLKSHGPTQRDPAVLSKMIHDLQDVFSVNTLMELAQPVFGRNFSRIDEDWADKPLKLVIAEMQQQQANAQPGDPNLGDGGATAAEDSNPDNQASTNEAQTSRQIVSDNKTKQPRTGNGQFGNSDTKKTPKKRTARVNSGTKK